VTLLVERAPRSAGVSANPYFLYGWHTYQWAVWAPPADWTAEVWTDFNPRLEPDPGGSGLWMLVVTVEVNHDGIVSIVWGDRSEAYTAEAGPVNMTAMIPQDIKCMLMETNKMYFLNAKWSGVITYPFGISRPMTVQLGELTGATTP